MGFQCKRKGVGRSNNNKFKDYNDKKQTTSTSIYINLENEDNDFIFKFAQNPPHKPGGGGKASDISLRDGGIAINFTENPPPAAGGTESNIGLIENISKLVSKARGSSLGNTISDLVSKVKTGLVEEDDISDLIGEETDVSSDSDGSVYSATDDGSVITEIDAK